jgi:hypothetical protein
VPARLNNFNDKPYLRGIYWAWRLLAQNWYPKSMEIWMTPKSAANGTGSMQGKSELKK